MRIIYSGSDIDFLDDTYNIEGECHRMNIPTRFYPDRRLLLAGNLVSISTQIEQLSEKYNGVGLTSKTKNRDDIIRDFKNNKIKRLFTHPKLLGLGLTFVNCTYNIYYSMSFSYEEFKQSQDRIHRIGQENKCTYIILQGKGTIDEKIYNCLQRKGNAVDELYMEMGLKVEN